jgi:hypothetical protein
MFLLNATYRKGDSDKALKEMQEECKKNGNAILDINKVHAILCSLVPGNSNNSTENIEKEITKDQQSDKAKLLTGIQRMEKMKNIKIRTILNLLRLLLHGEYKFKTNNTTENTTFIHELQFIISISTGYVEKVKCVQNNTRKLDVVDDVLAKLNLGKIGSKENPGENPGLEFLLNVARGKKAAWYVKAGDGIVSSKIHPKTDLVVAIAALAANDVNTIQTHCKILCSYLSLDTDIVLSIINIAVGEESKIRGAVHIIGNRVRSNIPICLSFTSGASLNYSVVLD